MYYAVEIKGIRPIIMHNGAAGLDTRSPANLEKAEIARKRGSNRSKPVSYTHLTLPTILLV